MSDVMADHLKWLDGKEDEAFQRGVAKGRIERDEDCDKALDAKEARIRELEEALRDARVFVQDCLDTGHDRGSLGNLMAARDVIDAALRAEPAGGGDQT